MSIDTAADLTTASDLELDAALRVGYAAHREADPENRLEIHAGIVAIISEQADRIDTWLASRPA